jgi:hypothetical protein
MESWVRAHNVYYGSWLTVDHLAGRGQLMACRPINLINLPRTPPNSQIFIDDRQTQCHRQSMPPRGTLGMIRNKLAGARGDIDGWAGRPFVEMQVAVERRLAAASLK